MATVVDLDTKTFTNYLNGFVTIQMKAYYPYGRCRQLFYEEGSEHADNMVANSHMLPESMAMSTSFADDDVELTTS